MRIRLKNFRCYEDSTFDLGDQGITLISAPSGYGKSTILNGIHFVLFGTGNKVTTVGKTSCLVELEFDSIKITRTKRPNRLVVEIENDIYEDEVAQQLINNKFGDNFDVTGYISQNAMNSFIMMNPMEKLSFLERFAFKDIDLNDIKLKCKANITQTHVELISNESQLQMAKKIIEEIPHPEEIKFPIKCKKSQIELAIKNENVRYKNSITLINKSQNNISKKEKELNSIQLLNTIIMTRNESIDTVNSKISDIELQLNSIDLSLIDEKQLEMNKRLLSNLILQRELIDLENMFNEDSKKLENMRLQEETEYQSHLDDIVSKLWKEYNPEELSDTLESLKATLNDIEKIENTKKELSKYSSLNEQKISENEMRLNSLKQELEHKTRLINRLKLQKELYSCPSCKSKLRLVKNSLCLEAGINSEDIEIDMNILNTEITQLNSSINTLNRSVESDKYRINLKVELENSLSELISSYEEIPEKDSITDDINYLKEYQIEQRSLEKKKKSIEDSIRNSIFSSSYNSFKNNVLSLQKKLDKLRNNYTGEITTESESSLREKIQLQTESINFYKRLNSNKMELVREKEKHENLISQTENEHKTKYLSIRTEYEIESEINILREEIQNLENKKEEYAQNIRLIDEWKRVQSDIQNYNEWKTRILKLEEHCEKSRKKHAASTILKEKILEAESIALLNIIDTINTHVQMYLDVFFPDDPITICLQTFKETKKNTKPSINLAIEYKGMECELNMLSGGELSRVILAYTLALGEIFNTPLLMLDESTASLDQTMTSCVFNGIKEHFNGKLVLIIAHQIVEGSFDRVIKLGSLKDEGE
jgi:DNA repair exonuclease SbcCD ATPase subunit